MDAEAHYALCSHSVDTKPLIVCPYCAFFLHLVMGAEAPPPFWTLLLLNDGCSGPHCGLCSHSAMYIETHTVAMLTLSNECRNTHCGLRPPPWTLLRAYFNVPGNPMKQLLLSELKCKESVSELRNQLKAPQPASKACSCHQKPDSE